MAYINVKSFRSAGKQLRLAEAMDSLQIHIALVSETHLTSPDTLKMGRYTYIHHGTPDAQHAGVSFLVRNDLLPSLFHFQPFTARHISISLRSTPRDLVFHAVYAPSLHSDPDQDASRKTAFW